MYPLFAPQSVRAHGNEKYKADRVKFINKKQQNETALLSVTTSTEDKEGELRRNNKKTTDEVTKSVGSSRPRKGSKSPDTDQKAGK